MKKLLIILLISIPTAIAQQAPDTMWTKTYDRSGSSDGWQVQQTSDRGLIIAGEDLPDFGRSNVYLIRTNASGETLWTHTYTHFYNEHGRSVRQTPDGGYIIAGSFGYDYNDPFDTYLIKTDSLGDTLWTRLYDVPNYEQEGRSIELTPDGGFAIAGCIHLPSYYSDVFVIKTDPNGDTLWTRKFGGAQDDKAWAIKNTSDGNLIIAGWSESNTQRPGNSDIFVIKIDQNGNLLWSRYYGTSGNDEGRDIIETSDNKYVIAGKFYPYHRAPNAALLCINQQGDSLWATSYPENTEANSISQTADGGFIICGYNLNTSYYAFIRKTDGNGNSLWASSITAVTNAHSVIQTIDGGYIFAGSFTTNYTRVYLVKFAPEETYNEDHNITPLTFSLEQNYPNPFNAATTISYELPKASDVKIEIYDIGGRKVASLDEGKQIAGKHSIQWNAGGLSSGVYFYKINAGNYSETKKLVLMK